MPLTGEAKKEYNKLYNKRLRDAIKRRKREAYLKKKREEELKGNYNFVDPEKTKKPSRKKPKVKVSKMRKFVVIDGRVYFNREIGFTLAEIKEAVALLEKEMKTQG